MGDVDAGLLFLLIVIRIRDVGILTFGLLDKLSIKTIVALYLLIVKTPGRINFFRDSLENILRVSLKDGLIEEFDGLF